MGADELVSLLVRLVNAPDDAETRRKAIDTLDARGLRYEAASLLGGFINFTGHEERPPLACLCKTCLPSAPATATADGLAFTRVFVVSGTRVLHFWLPDELATDRVEVKRAVAQQLQTRLARKRRRKA